MKARKYWMMKGSIRGTANLLGLLCCSVVMAQPYISRLGRFQVDQVRGCVPFTVTITDANLITTGECTGAKPCIMKLNASDPTGQQNQFTLVYTAAGTYTLQVLYQSIGPDDITITVDANIQPAYDLYSCGGNRVELVVTDKNYQQYVVDFNNDGTPETILPSGNAPTASFTYATSGNKSISVRGRRLSAADNCSPMVKTFIALAVLPATTITTLTLPDATSATLNFNPATNVEYRLEVATNSNSIFQTGQTLYGINTVTQSSLRVDDNYYCFRIGTSDPCLNTVPIYSNTVCSLNFDLVPMDGFMDLDWSAAGATNYTVSRDGAKITTTISTAYNDINVVCQTDYCYTIVANYPGNVRSTSLEKCGRAFRTALPPQVANVSAQRQTAGVDLTWVTSPSFPAASYRVYRSSPGGNLALIDQSPTNTYTDLFYTDATGFCYRFDYTEVCGNFSPEGIVACPMALTGSLNSDNSITLTWNAYTGWEDGVSRYLVEVRSKDGTLIRIVDNGTATSFTDTQYDPSHQALTYTVRAEPVNGAVVTVLSTSNSITFTKDPKIFNANAFTPNGDGLNDRFTVDGQYIQSIELKVFNRWGEMLFITDTKDSGWDGSFNGKPMPEGTYYYLADIVDLAGQSLKQSGTVVLLRK